MNNHKEVIVSKIPNCDYCKLPAKYDAKTRIGAWAHMCEVHFKKYGIKLGLGYGQKLIKEKKDE